MSLRRGFTLIELLVTIMIISMLSAMVLFGLLKVQAQTQAAKTKSTIAKIDGLLRPRWESFGSRRLPVSTLGGNPAEMAELRLVAMRQVQRMELPDRWSEVINAPSAPLRKIDGSNFTAVPATLTRTGLAEAYKRYYDTVGVNKSGAVPANDANGKPSELYQDAECLYMILTIGATDERSGREMFLDSEVGDVDKDGAPEFLDGWGMPIRFIRWPVGFVDDPQQDSTAPTSQKFGHLSDVMPAKSPTGAAAPLVAGKPDAKSRHDAFDPLNADPDAFSIYPLVFSAGPDRIHDINLGKTDQVLDDPYDIDPASATRNDANPTATYNPLDMSYSFYTPSAGLPKWMGIPHDLDYVRNGSNRSANGVLNHGDNIHNHEMDASLKD